MFTFNSAPKSLIEDPAFVGSVRTLDIGADEAAELTRAERARRTEENNKVIEAARQALEEDKKRVLADFNVVLQNLVDNFDAEVRRAAGRGESSITYSIAQIYLTSGFLKLPYPSNGERDWPLDVTIEQSDIKALPAYITLYQKKGYSVEVYDDSSYDCDSENLYVIGREVSVSWKN